MKPAAATVGIRNLLCALGLQLAALGVPTGHAVEKLGLAPYTATVTQASAADRLRITSLLTEIASANGMQKEAPPPHTLVYYTSPPSALGLTISANDEQDNRTVNITIGAAGLGIKLNEQRKAVINAVDAGLRRTFGARLKR